MILALVFLLAGLVSIAIGTTFAFFQADIKGETINEVSSSNIKIIYVEEQTPTVMNILSDEKAIESEEYFEFSLETITDNNTSYEYYIYLTEAEGNTISKEKIKVFLTNELDIPISDTYTTSNSEDGIYCYDYLSKNIYTKKDPEYKNCQNINLEEEFYMMDSLYYNQVDKDQAKVCRKYEKDSQGLQTEVTETSNCRYGDVYKAKPIKFTNLAYNENLKLNNIIYKGTYSKIDDISYYNKEKSSNKKTFRLRIWANGLENNEVNVNTTEGETLIEQKEESFKYKVNVFAKQIPLS